MVSLRSFTYDGPLLTPLLTRRRRERAARERYAIVTREGVEWACPPGRFPSRDGRQARRWGVTWRGNDGRNEVTTRVTRHAPSLSLSSFHTPLSSSIYSSGPCPPRSGPSGWRDTARRDGGYEWVTWGTVRFIFSSHIRRHRASLTRLPSGPPSLTRYAAEPGSLALGGWIEGEPYRISCLSSVSSLPSPFPFLFERERRNRHDNKTFINVGF